MHSIPIRLSVTQIICTKCNILSTFNSFLFIWGLFHLLYFKIFVSGIGSYFFHYRQQIYHKLFWLFNKNYDYGRRNCVARVLNNRGGGVVVAVVGVLTHSSTCWIATQLKTTLWYIALITKIHVQIKNQFRRFLSFTMSTGSLLLNTPKIDGMTLKFCQVY